MYTYHLWIVLAESVTEADSGRLSEKVQALRTLVAERMTPPPQSPINQINHEWVFQCSVSRNHGGQQLDRLHAVLTWICEHLPGSYGLVYLRDDEDSAFSGSYKVLVVARGRFVERRDPFLSPIVPTIED